MVRHFVFLSLFVFSINLKATSKKNISPRIQAFQCGENQVSDLSLFSPGANKGVAKKLVVSCFLIHHPKGILLWNTGLSDSLVTKKEGVSVKGGAFVLKVTKPMLQSLAELGVVPDDVQYVALSHLHPDHSGNLKAFKKAKILVQKEEFIAAMGSKPRRHSINPQLLPPKDSKQYQIVSDQHDVFGDGKIKLIFTPGHTPGHQSMKVELGEGRTVVLVGDLYHFKENRDHRRVPSFNYNAQLTRESMIKIEKLAKATNADIWIEHDSDQMQLLYHKSIL